jgi:hypothetical protein
MRVTFDLKSSFGLERSGCVHAAPRRLRANPLRGAGAICLASASSGAATPSSQGLSRLRDRERRIPRNQISKQKTSVQRFPSEIRDCKRRSFGEFKPFHTPSCSRKSLRSSAIRSVLRALPSPSPHLLRPRNPPPTPSRTRRRIVLSRGPTALMGTPPNRPAVNAMPRRTVILRDLAKRAPAKAGHRVTIMGSIAVAAAFKVAPGGAVAVRGGEAPSVLNVPGKTIHSIIPDGSR